MENTQTKTMIFIDSNYWIYLFDKTTPEHQAVKDHFREIYPTATIMVTVVVMMEVMHYLVKRLGPEIAQKKWELLSTIPFEIGDLVHIELDTVFDMLKTYSFTGIGSRDASILAYMKKKKIVNIATHDENFTRIESVEVIDPVRS